MLQEAPSLRIIVVFSTMPLLHEFSIAQSDRKSLSFQARWLGAPARQVGLLGPPLPIPAQHDPGLHPPLKSRERYSEAFVLCILLSGDPLFGHPLIQEKIFGGSWTAPTIFGPRT